MSPVNIFWSHLLLSYDILQTMDRTADPCQDFYQFACGKFEQRMAIPDDQASIDSFVLLEKRINPYLRALLEQPETNNDPKSVKFVKTQYKACMDVKRLEELGLDRLKQVVASFGDFPIVTGDKWNDEKFDWMQISAKTYHELGFLSLMVISVASDFYNSSKNILELDQCALGLGKREYYLEQNHTTEMEAYRTYRIANAVLIGADKKIAERDVDDLIAFETQLANITVRDEDRRNFTELYNITTVAELIKTYPKIPFEQFFNYLASKGWKASDDQDVNIISSYFMERLPALLESVPKRVIANYIMFDVMESFVYALAPSLKENFRKFRKSLYGVEKDKERWEQCVELVFAEFPLPVASMYVKEHFKPEEKLKMDEMIADLRESMRNTIVQNSWMDNETKTFATEKLVAMGAKIGYPPYIFNETRLLRDKENLVLIPNEYLMNGLELSKIGFITFKRLLHDPVNHSDWSMSAAEVNAQYSPDDNDITFPAAILQNPFYAALAPSYVNYARIGSVIGHEITHGYDDMGRQFDKEGNLASWWTPQTLKAYVNKSQCFIDQYDNIKDPATGINLNGEIELGENVADNGGVRLAYEAYQAWSRRQPTAETSLPRLKSYSVDQLFFINYAQVWCENIRKEALERQIISNEHAPNKYRVELPLQNFETFAKAFNCPKGTRMNPETRCRLW